MRIASATMKSSSVPIIDYGSTSVVLHSIRSHFPSGPLDYWESRLVIDSGSYHLHSL